MPRIRLPSTATLVMKYSELVGAVGRGDVAHRQGDTGDDLEDKRDQCRAAEHVPPINIGGTGCSMIGRMTSLMQIRVSSHSKMRWLRLIGALH